MSYVREHPAAVLFSVGLHAALGGALMLGFDFSPRARLMAPQAAIQAHVVDQAALQAEIDRRTAADRAEAERREREAREAREREDRARREREQEQQRQAEAERQRRAETERAEQLRVEREKAAAEERKAQAERERKQREEDERRAEAERQRRAEEEKRRLAAEAERRKQAELEAELARAIEAESEARRAQEAGLLDQYLLAIENQIRRNWIPPPTARAGLECVINVTQIPSGEVVGVSFGRCNGDDAVRRSIEAAVLKASPLPRPPVPSLFNRSVAVTFRPEV